MVRTGLIGIEMRQRRYGVRISSKVGGGIVRVARNGGGTGKRSFGASVETSSTGVVYGKGMRISTI